jgi:hypothetical protein
MSSDFNPAPYVARLLSKDGKPKDAVLAEIKVLPTQHALALTLALVQRVNSSLEEVHMDCLEDALPSDSDSAQETLQLLTKLSAQS